MIVLSVQLSKVAVNVLSMKDLEGGKKLKPLLPVVWFNIALTISTCEVPQQLAKFHSANSNLSCQYFVKKPRNSFESCKKI